MDPQNPNQGGNQPQWDQPAQTPGDQPAQTPGDTGPAPEPEPQPTPVPEPQPGMGGDTSVGQDQGTGGNPV